MSLENEQGNDKVLNDKGPFYTSVAQQLEIGEENGSVGFRGGTEEAAAVGRVCCCGE